MKQPVGVRILAISVGVLGSLATLTTLLLALLGAVILFTDQSAQGPWVGTVLIGAAGVALLLVLPLVAFAVGAWQGRRWAWWLGIVWFGLAALNALGRAAVSFTPYDWPQSIVLGAVALLLGGVVWYLLSAPVRQFFRTHSA